MKELFDISKFDSYRENNRLEVKSANGGLSLDLWESYSTFANTYGGAIILGVKENTRIYPKSIKRGLEYGQMALKEYIDSFTCEMVK